MSRKRTKFHVNTPLTVLVLVFVVMWLLSFSMYHQVTSVFVTQLMYHICRKSALRWTDTPGQCSYYSHIYKSKWVHNHTLQTNPRNCEEKALKSHRTTTATRHQEDKQRKATSSLFPIKVIAKLERTQSIAQQNIEQTQSPNDGSNINNRSTTTEPPF